MNVPLLDLKAQYQTIRADVQKAVDDVLESQMFILGPKVEELEKAVAAYSQTRFAVGVSSGTDALLVSLMALDVKPGDEVITTPFTFFATAGTIARLQARPVFVDIDPITFNLDPAKLEKAITPKTKAILPIHLFGQCADMARINAIAGKRGIPVVEDAAQSIGAEYQGRKAGSLGTIGIFSFFPSKNLGGIGDGGMVATNDPALYEKLMQLRVHGMKPKYYHKWIGGNFRLDAIQAAVLLVKLKHLDGWSRKRQENARRYVVGLQKGQMVEMGYILPPKAVFLSSGDANYHIYNQFTIRAKDRDGLSAHLRKKSIGHDIYYPVPLHLQECFAGLGHAKGDFPVSEKAAAEVLSLPVYPELTAEQQDYVIDSIAEFYGARA
jgi:dTDP-4-amino-4,6-dideoxygalactose transaminase